MTQTEILESCQHDRRPCEVKMTDGRIIFVCNECWNASVEARRALRKAQLDARPRDCMRCGRHPHTCVVWYQYKLCGRCWRAVRVEHNKALAAAGALAIFATSPLWDFKTWRNLPKAVQS